MKESHHVTHLDSKPSKDLKKCCSRGQTLNPWVCLSKIPMSFRGGFRQPCQRQHDRGPVGLCKYCWERFQRLANLVYGSGVGLQIGVYNYGESFRGMQLAAVNHTKKFSGLAIGAVNYTDVLNGLQIGVLNFNWHGEQLKFFPIFYLCVAIAALFAASRENELPDSKDVEVN